MKAAQQFAIDAIHAGWNVLIQHGADTGNSPFVSVEAKRDTRGISRNDQLKALGNGVVPQQCAAALRAFLNDTAQERAS